MVITLASRAGAACSRWLNTRFGHILNRGAPEQPCDDCEPEARSDRNLSAVALVLIDISGYTRFIKFHKTSLAHAQEIISQLLESVIDKASFPLTLNKLEGDAAFLYARLDRDETAAARDIVAQVEGFFSVFRAKARELSGSRAGCPCEACRRIRDLRLKAIVHRGQAAFRRIRQFEELAGEDVILVHRLLKNNVAEREYILMTEPVYRLLGDAVVASVEARTERCADLGTVNVKVLVPGADRRVFPALRRVERLA